MVAAEEYYVGVDVGTGSVRASLVKPDGTIIASSTQDILTFRDPDDYRIFEQSTANIWSAISTTIRSIVAKAKIQPDTVKGLGFDATCSLAVCDLNGEPVVITKGDQLGQYGERDVILWADHRAEEEANVINTTESIVLDYVGGTMSLEMEVPKILWLKRHMKPHLFARCQFFDLPDFLTYRATGDPTRSSCSLTCKCSFIPQAGWQSEFFQNIGLSEFVEKGYEQIGAAEGSVLTAGMPVGRGLSKKAADELGLVEGTCVGSGLIDAYAGWLGTIAARYRDENGNLWPAAPPSLEESQHRLAVVAGTSTCHLVQSPQGVFVNGVWGPYKDAVFRGWWMSEGGQSSTGQLIDFMITTHPAYPELVNLADREETDVHSILETLLEKLRVEKHADSLTELTKDMHFYPDLHGNRSPIADPRMRGSIVGLKLDASLLDLTRKYYLTLESIAFQTRHILDTMNASGHDIRALYVSGGQVRNKVMMRLLAEVCGVQVVLPDECGSAVVLGAGMLGKFAAEVAERGGVDVGGDALWKIMVKMTPPGTLIGPVGYPKERKILDAKYKIFRESIDIQKRWRTEMENASN